MAAAADLGSPVKDRVAALKKIGEAGSLAADQLASLLPLLKDKEWDIRLHTALAIPQVLDRPPEEKAKFITGMILDPKSPTPVRGSLCFALELCGRPGLEALKATLVCPEERVRLNSLHVLRGIRDKGTFVIPDDLVTLVEGLKNDPSGVGVGKLAREFLASHPKKTSAGGPTFTGDLTPGNPPGLAFRDDGQGSFVFDTGVVSGRIQKDGLGEGLQSVVLKEGNVRVDSDNHGLLIPYRFLTPQKRYGFGSWEWPRTGRLLPDGGIELRWASAADRPFSFTYTFRWPAADTLDTTLVFQPDADLAKFELFLGSYFRNFSRCAAYVPAAGDGRPGFLEAAKDQGGMQLFPRSEEVLALVRDGRWKFPPYPNDWSLRPSYAFPMGLRQDPRSGATVLLLAPPQDCFALSMSQQESGLGAYYLSLFGQDARRGQALTAHVRLVFGNGITAEQAVTQFQEYLKELRR